jgi:quinoprotein glucose dehydrogenase
MPRWLPALVLPLALAALTPAVPPEAQQPRKAAPSPDAEQAAKAAQVENGLKVEVWASEPLLANPVSFAFDEHGRCFLAETYRHTDGVTDTRGHMYWLDDDLAIRSIADRLAMYKKYKYPPSEKFGEQVRLIWDSTGSGKADRSTVFAGPFNRPQDGLGAGVLARKGDVYFTCIPDLYRLRDTKGENRADVVESLATGFGLHVQFIGHDLHGLRMGPDGKLYMSIGDRGLTVTTKEGKKLFNPDSGAVLRCDPDGSNLEIVHIGLRNPQELAFDDYGNLFTFDNNSDSGDKARWVQVVEGGDSGWRCGYQFGTLMHHKGVPQGNRGPWNAEKMWYVPGPDGEPPAYVVPPLAHFGNGPSGITYYPGVGLPDRYKGHFFATDFTSTPAGSVIWSLALKPKGASFEVVDLHPFVRGMVPTDCEFGPDGAFYWSDWVGGWDKPGKGRIFRVTDPEAMKDPAVAEAKKLFAEGFGKKSVEELTKLLEHPHRQVRQEAQFELASRKPDEAIPAFVQVTKESKNQLARLHAVWGLGMAATQARKADPAEARTLYRTLTGLTADADSVVRLAAVKVLGHQPVGRNGERGGNLIPEAIAIRNAVPKLLSDDDPAVRAAAAFAYVRCDSLGRAAYPGWVQEFFAPLFDLLKSNNDRDAYVRHAAVEALTQVSRYPEDLFNAWTWSKPASDNPAVRLGVVLALRKLRGKQLGEFLADADPRIVAEAARAICDQDLMQPMELLAKLADKPGLPEPVAYRALAANYKLGKPEGVARVAGFAARADEPEHIREFALKLLADWARPPRRDPIVGTTISLPERPAADAVAALKPVFKKLLVGPGAVREAAAGVAAKLNSSEFGPLLAALAADAGQPSRARVAALFALDTLHAKELPETAAAALGSPEPRLRAAARVVKAKADPAAAARELPALLNDEKATVVEKQMALAALGSLKESKEIDEALAGWLDRYADGKVPDELKLDVLEAARERAEAEKLKLHAPLREKLRAIDRAARTAAAKDPLARHRETLAGGDAEKGRAVFLDNSAVSCQKCHKLDGQGGEVGPPLNGIGAKQSREYLLESILYPNAKIAEGYQSVILNTVDGRTISGVLRKKDASGYTVVTADNKVVVVPKDDVDSEKPDKSAMPDDLHKKLSKRELRDLVEFLASLKK